MAKRKNARPLSSRSRASRSGGKAPARKRPSGPRAKKSKPRARKSAARPKTRRSARGVMVKPMLDLAQLWSVIATRVPVEFRVSVRRPDDLLVFDLLFDNLRIEAGPAPRLVKKNPNATATLIVEFQPQSFGEQAFLAVSPADPSSSDPAEKEVSDEAGYPKKNVKAPGEPVPPLPSAKIRMAGRSRLAFLMPAGESALAYTLADVLRAMRTWPMRLDSSAVPEPARRLVLGSADDSTLCSSTARGSRR